MTYKRIESIGPHDGGKEGRGAGADKRPYAAPAILSTEPLEAVAAVCASTTDDPQFPNFGKQEILPCVNSSS
jgi:hypothetical protein